MRPSGKSAALLEAAADALDRQPAASAGAFLEDWFADAGLTRDQVLQFVREKSVEAACHWRPILDANGLTDGSLGAVIAVAMLEGFTLGAEFVRAELRQVGANR